MRKSYNLITILFVQILFAFVLTGSAFSQGSIAGTVKYSDNNMPVSNGTVKAYDLNGIEIANTIIHSDGTYYLPNLPGIQLDVIGLVDDELGDFISAYYPNKEEWLGAVPVTPVGQMENINIIVQRTGGPQYKFTTYVSGTITLNGEPLKDAVIYAKYDGVSQRCGRSDENGNYVISGLTERNYILVVHRIGCTSEQKIVNVKFPGTEKVDFDLEKAANKEKSSIIKDFKLSQNYPNPFNPSTRINFTIPSAGNVNLTVFNIEGQVIKVLVNDYREAGTYTTEFNGESLASGVYYYRLETRGFAVTRKMTMVK